MSIIAVDELMLREPGLLTPNKPPVGNTRIDWAHPLAEGLIWFALPSFSGNVNNATHGHRNMVGGDLTTQGEPQLVLVSQGEMVFAHADFWYSYAVSTYTGALFDNLSKLTLSSGLLHVSTEASINATKTFRKDYIMTLDWFAHGPSTINWGCDWFGAWNGAEQVTTNHITGPLNMMVVINAGARFFQNGQFAGTKSGTDGNTGTVGDVKIIDGSGRWRYYAAWKRALSDAEARSFTADPYQILVPA